MPESAGAAKDSPLAGPELRIGYGITVLAGLMAGSFFDAVYQGNGRPGRLVFCLYQLFLGPFGQFWLFHVATIGGPLILVNGLNYILYRRSRVQSERAFFLLLSVILNGLVFFAFVNAVAVYFL